MTKSTDIRLCDVSASTQYFKYRAPAKFGGREVTDAVVFDVTAEVQTHDGRRGPGHGSMTMGNIWAWPSRTIAAEQTLAAMIELGHRLARIAGDYRGIGHPLEIMHELTGSYQPEADAITRAANLSEPMPRLAQLVAASPLDAAIHDAFGKTLGQNSYNLLGSEFVSTDLASYLTPDFAGEYLDRYTLRQPKPRMPLYHLIGALDPLTDADVAKRIDDGLPETLPEWIAADGLTHLKIKLNGDDLAWDVARMLSIERVAAEAQAARGRRQWFYSADFNEQCADVEYLFDFLARIQEHSPQAFARMQYIEQPTRRDLRESRQSHASGGANQAGRDRRIVSRFGKPAAEPRAWLLRRGAQGVQGAQRGIADGSGGAEIWNVSLRAGPDVPRRVVPSFGESCGARTGRRGD